jgi:hypothetical protein
MMSNVSVHPERNMSTDPKVSLKVLDLRYWLFQLIFFPVPGQFWRAESLAEFELITGRYIYITIG